MREPIPFGRYLLLDRVAVGGMAEIFVARVREGRGSGRLVALKRLLPHLADDPAMVSRFLDEARIARRLACPSIVAVEDLGQLGAAHYIVLEWVPGRDLRAVQAALAPGGRRMPVALAVLCGLRVFEALERAHSAGGEDGQPPGIVHRDVSPGNVLLSFAGEVKLGDFGIAEVAGRPGAPGALRGKLAYLAPEVAAGSPAGPEGDLFAVGVLLHELLTGRRLYRAESEALLLERVRAAEVEPPSRHAPGIPPELERLVLGVLARDPAARAGPAGALASALRPWADREERLSAWLCGLFPDEARRERERLLSGRGAGLP